VRSNQGLELSSGACRGIAENGHLAVSACRGATWMGAAARMAKTFEPAGDPFRSLSTVVLPVGGWVSSRLPPMECWPYRNGGRPAANSQLGVWVRPPPRPKFCGGPVGPPGNLWGSGPTLLARRESAGGGQEKMDTTGNCGLLGTGCNTRWSPTAVDLDNVAKKDNGPGAGTEMGTRLVFRVARGLLLAGH